MVFEIERPRPVLCNSWLDQFNGLWQFVAVEIGTNNLGYPCVRVCVSVCGCVGVWVRVYGWVGGWGQLVTLV